MMPRALLPKACGSATPAGLHAFRAAVASKTQVVDGEVAAGITGHRADRRCHQRKSARSRICHRQRISRCCRWRWRRRKANRQRGSHAAVLVRTPFRAPAFHPLRGLQQRATRFAAVATRHVLRVCRDGHGRKDGDDGHGDDDFDQREAFYRVRSDRPASRTRRNARRYRSKPPFHSGRHVQYPPFPQRIGRHARTGHSCSHCFICIALICTFTWLKIRRHITDEAVIFMPSSPTRDLF